MANAPRKVRLLDINGDPFDGNTLPDVGRANPEYSLPVILAKGVNLAQSYIAIPAINKSSTELFNTTLIKLLDENFDRRYLKIVNNGPNDVEIWSGSKPAINDVGQTIPRGEVLLANGFGIMETDTCRTSIIYASCSDGDSGILVLEG